MRERVCVCVCVCVCAQSCVLFLGGSSKIWINTFSPGKCVLSGEGRGGVIIDQSRLACR